MTCVKAITQIGKTVTIQLHVIPGSSQSIFPIGYNTWRQCIEMKVKAIAQDNKANNEVKELIASFFHIPRKDISIISGHKQREKTISIKNGDINSICKKIKETINGL